MPTDDQAIKLVLQIQGQEQAAALEKQISALRSQIVAMGSSASATDPMMVALGLRMKGMQDDAAKLQRSFGRGGLTDAVQGSSRALQDFTSAAMNGGAMQGLNAITNNVDQVVHGFAKLGGMSTTTATALASFGTFAVVGLQLAIPLIKAGAEYMGLFAAEADKAKTPVERLQEKIKELTDKPNKLQFDLNELHAAEADVKRITEALATYHAASGLKSEGVQSSESAIDKVIAESSPNAKATMDSVRTSVGKGLEVSDSGMVNAKAELKWAKSSQAKGEIDAEGYRGNPNRKHMDFEGSIDDWVSKATAAVNAASEAIYNPETGSAAKHVGQMKRDDPQAFAAALDKAGQGDVASQVRKITPEAFKEAKDLEAESKRGQALFLAEEEYKERAAKKATDFEKRHEEEMAGFIKNKDEEHKKALDYEARQKQFILGIAKQEAADYKAAHGGETMEQEHKRLTSSIDKQHETNQAQSNAQAGRMANASGLGGVVSQLMFQARQNAVLRREEPQLGGEVPEEELRGHNAAGQARIRRMHRLRNTNRTTAQRRAAARAQQQPMTFEETEAARTKSNAATDKQLEARTTAALLGQDGRMVRGRRMQGSRAVTNDPNRAAQMAHNMVQTARKTQDSQTGDQPLVENIKGMKTLGDQMKELTSVMEKGVTVKLD